MGDRTLDSEEFHSAELQLAAIDRELERQFPDGWEPVPVMGNYDGAGPGIWADFDVSGRTWSRVGLEAALDAVTEHKAEALGVLNLSRWARHVLNALKRMEELEKRGAALYSAQERTEMKTPAGKFSTFMFLAVAQLLSDQKSEEWSTGMSPTGLGCRPPRLRRRVVRGGVGVGEAPLEARPGREQRLLAGPDRRRVGGSSDWRLRNHVPRPGPARRERAIDRVDGRAARIIAGDQDGGEQCCGSARGDRERS